MDIKKLIDSLTIEEKIGQLLCFDVYPTSDFAKMEELFSKVHPGAIFFKNLDKDQIKKYVDMASRYSKLPLLVSSDVEAGPGDMIVGEARLTQEMAWGACDDPSLLYEAGLAIGERCRELLVNYNFSPIVDLSLNFRATSVNVRSISSSPNQVIKMASSYIKGLEHNGNMAATIKHFPGEGVDERNPHFVTTINPMSRQEWMDLFGKIYKALIDNGVYSVMVGHSSLPCFEKEIDPFYGPSPACLSYSLITDLLKGELGFKGVVVSDAMAMIGVSSYVKDDKEIPLRFLNAGGDLILFPDEEFFSYILEAYNKGQIKPSRIIDALTRIIELKEKLHLFDPSFKVNKESKRSISSIGKEIASKSIKVVRNISSILPLDSSSTKKVLMIDILEPYFHKEPNENELSAFRKRLEENGIEVKEMLNPDYSLIKDELNEYDAVIACCKMSSDDYHGGTLRMGWNNIMPFWRGYVLRHPRFIFVSFGDPYRIYDVPYVKTYINAFSNTGPSQIAAVDVILGKIKPLGKNPVSFPPYFDKEVE